MAIALLPPSILSTLCPDGVIRFYKHGNGPFSSPCLVDSRADASTMSNRTESELRSLYTGTPRNPIKHAWTIIPAVETVTGPTGKPIKMDANNWPVGVESWAAPVETVREADSLDADHQDDVSAPEPHKWNEFYPDAAEPKHTCPRCQGTGTHGPAKDGDTIFDGECSLCGGDGEIPVVLKHEVNEALTYPRFQQCYNCGNDFKSHELGDDWCSACDNGKGA